MRYRKLSDLTKDIETREGQWSLGENHELIFRERGLEKEAVLSGSIVAAEPEALVISVTVREDAKRTVTGIVKLAGGWSLDRKNRITFLVKRGFGRDDKLTFRGAWEINKNYEVVYTYETQAALKGSGKTRRRVRDSTHELVFKGCWDISGRNQLTYLLGVENAPASVDEESAPAFHFRGTFETTSLVAKPGKLCFQAGVEYQNRRGTCAQRVQTIKLFGKWKLLRGLALSFELESAQGKKSRIIFGATLAAPKDADFGRYLPDEIAVNLTARSGERLGLELVLAKDFFGGDLKTFLRFVRTADEAAVEAGVRLAW